MISSPKQGEESAVTKAYDKSFSYLPLKSFLEGHTCPSRGTANITPLESQWNPADRLWHTGRDKISEETSFMCRLQKERPLPQSSDGRGNIGSVLNERDCVFWAPEEHLQG